MQNKHCPGLDAYKTTKIVNLICPNCGTAKEIFSDEIKKEHVCQKCLKQIDMAKAKIEEA